MSRQFICISTVLIAQFVLVSQVEAQIIRRLRERRAAVAAAAAQDPAAAPGDPVAAAAPLPRLRGLLARRLQAQQDLVAQEEHQPTPATPDQKSPANSSGRLAARRSLSGVRQASANQTPKTPRFTLADLAKLDVNGLQSALANVDGALRNDLDQFSSADSWQGFLHLPEGVVDEQTVDPAALDVSLDRFNRVANNPKFSQISSLSSFEQTRGILAELANRVTGPQLVSPTGEATPAVPSSQEDAQQATAEELPSPQEVSTPARVNKRGNRGEHSILVRSE